jgi:hypothetical protein
MKRLVLELDDKLHKAFKVKTTQRGISMRRILTILLTEWMKLK